MIILQDRESFGHHKLPDNGGEASANLWIWLVLPLLLKNCNNYRSFTINFKTNKTTYYHAVQCHGSDGLSLACTDGGPGSIPDYPRWYLQWERRHWHWRWFFCKYLVFPYRGHSATASCSFIYQSSQVTLSLNNACKYIYLDRLTKITKYFIRTDVWPSNRIQLTPADEARSGCYE
jgi:hypothetical protein